MKEMLRNIAPVVLGLLVVTGLIGCGGDDETAADRGTGEDTGTGAVIDPGDAGNYDPDVDPATFVETIDNRWLPFERGRRWVYEGEDEGEIERIEVTVTDEAREVMGISATVVRDTVTVDDELVEDTFDWFAQDADGTVWYLGEESTEYEDGEAVSTEGSWEAGVDGALPGVLMWADPVVGQAYRQEYDEGEAEDMAEVVRFEDAVTVEAGTFENVLVIREWNPFEPEVVEEKYYAEGVGLILEEKVQGEEGRVELIEYEPAA